MIDSRDFISAGYYLTQPTAYDLEDEKIQALIPNSVLSLSSCVSPAIPDNAWEHQNDKFGLSKLILTEMNTYFSEIYAQQKIGYLSTWYNLDNVRGFLAKFGQYLPNVTILGRGIHSEILFDIQELAREEDESAIKSGYGKFGIYECILANQSLDEDGQLMGYEVIGVGHSGLQHSMYCYNLIDDFAEQFNATPNENGFYNDFHLAQKCAYKANDYYDDPTNPFPLGDSIWYPLLVVKYDW